MVLIISTNVLSDVVITECAPTKSSVVIIVILTVVVPLLLRESINSTNIADVGNLNRAAK